MGGRLGFKGRGPSGGRGLLSGVTSPVLLCRGCCWSGRGVEVVAGAGAGAGTGTGTGTGIGPGAGARARARAEAGTGTGAGAASGLVTGGLCCLCIIFCCTSPVGLTL